QCQFSRDLPQPFRTRSEIVMESKVQDLSALERLALSILCEEAVSTGAPVDAISFRADHEELRPAIARLCQLRYVEEDQGALSYSPTVTGLRESGTPGSKRVLE